MNQDCGKMCELKLKHSKSHFEKFSPEARNVTFRRDTPNKGTWLMLAGTFSSEPTETGQKAAKKRHLGLGSRNLWISALREPAASSPRRKRLWTPEPGEALEHPEREEETRSRRSKARRHGDRPSRKQPGERSEKQPERTPGRSAGRLAPTRGVSPRSAGGQRHGQAGTVRARSARLPRSPRPAPAHARPPSCRVLAAPRGPRTGGVGFGCGLQLQGVGPESAFVSLRGWSCRVLSLACFAQEARALIKYKSLGSGTTSPLYLQVAAERPLVGCVVDPSNP